MIVDILLSVAVILLSLAQLSLWVYMVWGRK